MTTARTLITDALVEIGVQDIGESLDATTAEYALRTLNRTLDRCNLTDAFVYSVRRQVFTATFDNQDYTFGSGGVWGSVDNGRIVRATIDQGAGDTVATELEMIDYRAWADISDRVATGKPVYLYDERNEAGGLNTVWLWPIPDANYSIALFTQKEVPNFATLDTALSAPPIYEELLLTELAIALAGPLHAQVPETLVLRNRKAWDTVTIDNQLQVQFDPSSHYRPIGGRADYKTGRLV